MLERRSIANIGTQSAHSVRQVLTAYNGKAPDEVVWAEPERQTRAVREYLASLEAENEPNPDRKPPKVISPSDPCSAWTAKANKRVQFGYGLNYLVDIENAVIVDVEPTPARTYDEVESTKTDAGPHRASPQSKAQAACRRHRLWNGPFPKLVGWPWDCTTYSRSRCQRAQRRLMGTKRFLKSRDERKRVEMRFAHLKIHHGFERMRLRGLSGARDEFHLAAIVQNLKTLALRSSGPPVAPEFASTS